MGSGHRHGASGSLTDGLLVDTGSPVHALPAEVKVVALLAFVLVVVSTPREHPAAFAGHALVAVAVVGAARLPPPVVVRRLAVEAPFVVFALLLPFVALGERVDLGPVSVSAPGLLGAVNVLAKATLGVLAAVVLSATTRPRDLVVGLQRLRVPSLLVTILAFMVRYLDVVVDDLRRMRIAREARGFRARHLGHAPVLARSAGALFVRSFERGERVHLAMLSRGFTGTLPVLDDRRARTRDWLLALVPALAALAATLAALTLGAPLAVRLDG